MAANLNLLDPYVRTQVIQDIENEENYSRKREAQRRFDVYRNRQDRYILERLQKEFSIKTVAEMRTILSINLTEKIINTLSSIYKNAPKREFENATEKEKEQIDNLYDYANFDPMMKMANRYYNLFDDLDILVVPKNGKICVRPMTKMGYDIVPDANDPERPYALIINTFDLEMHKTAESSNMITDDRTNYYNQDNQNQKIADDDDRKAELSRYIVWTKDLHFTMNGKGEILGEVVPNPIGMLPIVNIALEKDNQYFVRRGSTIPNFAIEFSACLSDLSNIVKLQGYAQAVITSEKAPTDLRVGPNNIIWLQQDPNATKEPKFEFVSPNPDIAASLEFLETMLRLFLSSRDIDPKAISGKLDGTKYSSGVERLLAMIDTFAASADDIDIFKNAEYELFDLMRAWSNVMQGVNDESKLDDDLNISTISENVKMSISYKGPEAVKTDVEKLDVVERRMDRGLMSKKGAIMELDGVTEDMAEELLVEIQEDEQEEMDLVKQTKPQQEDNNSDGETSQGTNQDGYQADGGAETEDQPEGNVRDQSQ